MTVQLACAQWGYNLTHRALGSCYRADTGHVGRHSDVLDPAGRRPVVDLDRFAADAPDDDAPDDAQVCVVATQPETFERCRDGFYPAPRSYDRTRTQFDYMAFYRTAPVSAVTHYARVTDRTEQRRGEAGRMDGADWEALIDPFSDERTVLVFEFDDLVPLDSPVENDRNGVRGAWYCTVADLRAAGTVSELGERSTGV